MQGGSSDVHFSGVFFADVGSVRTAALLRDSSTHTFTTAEELQRGRGGTALQ